MSSPFSPTRGFNISSIELVNVPSGYGTTYSVEISQNKAAKRQLHDKRVDENCIVWSESLPFVTDLTAPSESFLHFKIVRTRFGLKKTLGSWEKKVRDLFRLQEDIGMCKIDFSKSCELIFKIEQQGDILSELVKETKNTPAGSKTSTSEHPMKVANVVMGAHDILTDQEDIWTPFLSHFEIFMKAIDTISEVHPYVKLAWGVLSVIPKTIISQSNRDDNIDKLVQRLKEVYDYITDANRLPTLKETQSRTLSVLVQQTIECGYFLREYNESHTAKKILTGVSIDGKISDFNEKFDHILNVMMNSVALETNIVALRISTDICSLRRDIRETNDLNLLGELPYAQDAGFRSTKCCLPGTREKLITGILDWVNGNGSQKVLLLLGQAGTGKSAVAHTISQIFDKQNRLGSLFCFNRSYKDRRNLLFSTISRQIADGDVQWWESLVRMITKTSIRTSLDSLTQFNELIVKPSKEVNTIGPVVIVIDGLDESGDRRERGELLEILKRCSELPSNYYFLITSRPESDIEEWCQHPTVLCKRVGDINLDETTKDIQQYILFRLSRVKVILDNELDGDWSLLLAEQAEGLFQWASTVCNFIDPTVEFGVVEFGVVEKVKSFISGPTSSLYNLYHQIFSSQPEFRRVDFLPAFKKIMGALIIMQEPPSTQALQGLFQDDIRYSVNSIMQPFHSLFLGTHDPFTPIQPLHTSLVDFLATPFIEIVDENQEIKMLPNQFYIDTRDEGYFTLACLKLMNSSLHFNICDLKTSHKLNQDVPDLKNRIQTAIFPHLSYACYFWATHLKYSEKQSKLSDNLLEQLRLLIHTNVLYLFEALGLLKDTEQVCISMNILAEWCEGVDDELAKQAKDTCQFGYDFGDVIAKSTPHLYISALPFARPDSFIREQFLNSFPHHFRIELGQSLDLLRGSAVMKRDASSKPYAIAFSPRDNYIATGFRSGAFWLWNYRTGEIVHEWGGQQSSIRSIVFSPNGELVTACFSDASTQIWNIDRNELVHTSGFTGPHNEYCTISSDGHYLVIHYSDETLLYDTTALSSEPDQLAYFHRGSDPRPKASSIFSPNGELLAFQERSDVISLLHIQTGEVIGSLDLSQAVHSMAFFPDGNRIAVGKVSDVEIWDVPTRTKICGMAFGYQIRSKLVIFPDGQNLIFSSYRDTYIWNVSTRELIQSFPSESPVRSLAVSPDSKHIALVREDRTIEVRDWEGISGTADVRDDFRYTGAQLSPGGRYLILEGEKTGQNYLQISNTTAMGEMTAQVALRKSIIALSPDDRHIAYVAINGLCLWTDRRGELVLDTSDCDFTALAFSFNGDCLLSGDLNGSVIIWNTHTCKPSKLMTSEASITALAFSTMGTRFLAVCLSSSTQLVEIRDSQSGEQLKGPFTCATRWAVRDNKGCLVAFSTNESRIVYLTSLVGSVLDAETGQILQTFKTTWEENSLKLSPNRKWVWSKLGAQLWDIDKGVAIQGAWLASQSDEVFFSNDSDEFITVHTTGRVDFWNISTGNKTMTRTFHHYTHPRRRARQFVLADSTDASVSTNKSYLILVADGSVKVWSLGTHRAISRVSENQAEVERSEAISGPNPSRFDNWKGKEYAELVWQKALFSDSSEMDEDGWILGPNGELLFWVPKERRVGFWRPNMVHAAGRAPITILNFSNFVHGSRWTECKKPLTC